jgi:hypothetical protein
MPRRRRARGGWVLRDVSDLTGGERLRLISHLLPISDYCLLLLLRVRHVYLAKNAGIVRDVK